jgi:hypothetical protein
MFFGAIPLIGLTEGGTMAKVLRLPISNVPADGDYTAAIAVGSEGSTAHMLLDTGSSTLGIIPGSYEPARDTNSRPPGSPRT